MIREKYSEIYEYSLEKTKNKKQLVSYIKYTLCSEIAGIHKTLLVHLIHIDYSSIGTMVSKIFNYYNKL